jgi:hypothetical protein
VTTIPTYVLWVIGGILPMAALIVGLTTVLVKSVRHPPRKCA